MNYRYLVPAFAAAILLAGCADPTAYASTPAYNRHQVEDIIAMSKAGEPDGRIIAKLQEAGVSLRVLDYMQQTYLRGVRHEERFQTPGRFSSTY